jgi:hypothetical protein
MHNFKPGDKIYHTSMGIDGKASRKHGVIVSKEEANSYYQFIGHGRGYAELLLRDTAGQAIFIKWDNGKAIGWTYYYDVILDKPRRTLPAFLA